MQLQFLGTGAGVPSKARNVSSVALKMLDERNEVWLFDCGEATQHTILKTTIRPRKITKIFITHLHGDHIFGLPGLLSSRAFQGGEDELTIYGPVGIKEFVLTSLKVSQSHLKYRLSFIELATEGIAFSDEKTTVYYRTLKHGIQSYGYRIEEHDYPGELQVEKLKMLGIPSGPLYGQLKRGENVTLEDGRQLRSEEFVGKAKKGRTVVILGDTRYHTAHIDFCRNANVLVHEATFAKNEEKLAHDYFHSTSYQAGILAEQANVLKLYLTHISSRYLNTQAKQLEQEAKQVFKNTQLVHDLFEEEVKFSD